MATAALATTSLGVTGKAPWRDSRPLGTDLYAGGWDDGHAEYVAKWNEGADIPIGFRPDELLSEVSGFGLAPLCGVVKGISDVVAMMPLDAVDDRGRPVPRRLAPAWTTSVPVRGMSQWTFKKMASANALVRGLSPFQVVRRRPDDRRVIDILRPLPAGRRYLSISAGPGTDRAVRVDYTPDERFGAGHRVFVEWMGPTDRSGDCVIGRYDDDGSLEGRSMLRAAGRAVWLALAVNRHAELFHLTGGTPPWIGHVKGSEQHLKSAAKAMKQVRENPSNRFYGMFVGAEDLSITQLKTTARESQLLQAREMTYRDICALYNFPAPMMGSPGTMWGQAYEQIKRGYYGMTVRPWVRFLEDLLTMTLPEGMFAKFDAHEMLRGDPESHRASLVEACGGPYLTTNEARAEDNYEAMDGEEYDEVRSTATAEAPEEASDDGEPEQGSEDDGA